jgi:hypothetical protein
MANGEQVLESLTEMDRYMRDLGRSLHPSGILDTVRAYLCSWSPERIAKLQRIDAGWAPFDEFQHPTEVCSAADLRRIGSAVHSQCKALKAIPPELTLELLELDRFLFVANQMLGRLEQQSSTTARDAAQLRNRVALAVSPVHRSAGRPF